ncbi:hypothetical protein BZG72_16010, partial [Salinivibrio sp. PR6]|uniref:glycosyltransferase family 2 protein n=1 Tax=Salinivibrio sp. PR6 TaxID=1909485 RepID=UPI0009CC0494
MVFSVIIPNFNNKHYILGCLDSVYYQEFDDFEIILVDDGSTDESMEIIERHTIGWRNFKIVNKENGGVSSARNNGMDLAIGEYLVFVDGDDWLEPGYLRFAYEKLKQGYDSIVFNYHRAYEIDSYLAYENLTEKEFTSSEIIPLFFKQVISNAPWNKIFPRSSYENPALRFPQGVTVGEDAVMTFELLMNSSNLLLTNRAFYNYRETPNSATNSKVSD